MDQLRSEKEKLTATMAEVAEKLRSQESQTQFLEQARTDLLTQFRSLSGQMLDGSREALLKSTKETVSEPFAKEVLQLRQQVEALQKESNAKLTVLAETTRDLRQRSEDVQGAAQQLTSALRSPNVKGQWGEVNLRRILEFVGLIAYCDFDEQVHVGTEEGAYRPDCVITIPGSRRLIVDSKAPIESYLDALQANDQAQREAALNEHLKKVRSHIDLLSKKDYAGKLSALGQVVDGGGAVHPGGRCPVDGIGAGSAAAGVRLQQEHHPHLPHQPAGDLEGIGDDHPAGGDRQKHR